MKKVILYFIAFILVCFFLPAILTKKMQNLLKLLQSQIMKS